MTTLSLELPFRIDGAGRIAATADPNRQVAIRLMNLIGTSYAERVMRLLYGSGLRARLFDVNDPLQLTVLASQIGDTVRTWEPTVTVDDVRVRAQDPAGGQVELEISYHFIATGEAFSLAVVVGATATYGWPEGG